MSEINIPARLNELVLNSESGFQIGSEWNPCDFSDEEIKNHFDDFAGISSSDGGLDVLTQDTIDTLYNLISNFRNLSDENKDLFAQSFTELSAQAIETIRERLNTENKNARKQVIYFLVEFLKINEEVAKEENAEIEKLATQKGAKVPSKGKGKSADQTYSWTDWRHSCLKLIFQAVCSEPSHLWNMGVVQENYLRGMWASALSMLVDKPKGMGGPGVLESTIRGLCVGIITRCASLFGNGSGGSVGALSSALLDAVIKTEHMANFVAEICNKSKQTPLCREVLLAISHLHITSMSLGAKNIGSFIEALAKVNPVLMSSHLATLKGQIDSPAHQIRSSLLQAMGLVVSSIHKASLGPIGLKEGNININEKNDDDKDNNKDNNDEDEDQKDLNDVGEEEDGDKGSQKVDEGNENKNENDPVSDHNMAQLSRVRDSLLDLLTERTHDISYFTRAAVLKVTYVHSDECDGKDHDYQMFVLDF